jgi:hypothetical protein
MILGTNPTIVSYNASAVNIYNTTSSLVHFENRNIFFCFKKTLYVGILLQRWRCSCKFESRWIGL